MELLRSPKGKLVAAAALLAALALAASAGGMNAAGIARWVLGAVALVALVLWVRRARQAGALGEPARLAVISRAGLSQRCGVALVEADGCTYLVVHGDGYAEMRETPAAAAPKARRPRPVRVRRSLRKGAVR